MSKKEQRTLEIRRFPFELRATADGSGVKLEGYASVFNQRSEEIWPGFLEEVVPGAFKKTLQESDVRSLWNHDANFVLGRVKSGTLALSEDARGLAVMIDPPDTQLVRDMCITPMRRGDVDQMSFGFETIRDDWKEEGSTIIRKLLEVRLIEVSPCTIPAYPGTSISPRCAERVAEFRSKRGLPSFEISNVVVIPQLSTEENAEPVYDHSNDYRRMRLEITKRRFQLSF